MVIVYSLVLLITLGTIFLPIPLWSKRTSCKYMPALMGFAGIIISDVIAGALNGIIFSIAGSENAIMILLLPALILSAFIEVFTMYLIFRYFGRKFDFRDAVSLGLGFGSGLTCYQLFRYNIDAFSGLIDEYNKGIFSLATGWTFLFSNALYYVFWTILFTSVSILLYKGMLKRSKKEIAEGTAFVFITMLLPRTINTLTIRINIPKAGGLALSFVIICALVISALVLLVKGIKRKKILIYLPYIILVCLCLVRLDLALFGVFAYVATYTFIFFVSLHIFRKFEMFLRNEKERLEKEKEESEEALHSYY